ncbi:hypothetical protein IQ268_15945 [Oculatella sp. LEGE 06141]|uniref:hypothetical protein n=1 Tax=Oculatella sp. LEGE 06141 TaxID=1828648 RepID=UPI00187F5905|nr:hypothetical protein [Oculatella sp. LEGE 06141]MBE9180063.1 hypothetical protein [Oculatella sp. LEGE 06141]
MLYFRASEDDYCLKQTQSLYAYIYSLLSEALALTTKLIFAFTVFTTILVNGIEHLATILLHLPT